MRRYQPHRDGSVDAVLDLVEASTGGRAPRILDLGGGTGSVCQRALARWPRADLTLLDLDPVLMAIAATHLPATVHLTRADLRQAGWAARLPHQCYDAVVAVMALHYLPADRLTILYREVASVLRPGGLVINLDRMPDPGLPGLSGRTTEWHRASRPAGPGWDEWWALVAADPALGPAMAERSTLFAGQQSAEWTPAATWHLRALRAAGYIEVGVGWRHGVEAAVVAVTRDAD
jgi:SAM-dependent methyltransferase